MSFDFATWPPGAIAAFLAACIAGLVAIANLIATLIDGNVSRKKINDLARREQWWTRWSWTIEKSLSKDAQDRFMGQAMMDALVDQAWLTEDDKRMALAIATAIVKRDELANELAEEDEKRHTATTLKGRAQAVANKFRSRAEDL